MVILIVLLLFNSYAWFIYATRVSMGMTAHVTSWNINFMVGEEEIETNMKIDVGRIYPGMETFVKEIEVENRGETKAVLKYEIDSITILGDHFSRENGMTSDELENKIKNEYPFHLTIEMSDGNLNSTNGKGKFSIKLEWLFDNSADELDTYWGEKAYEYYAVNPDSNSVEIELKLIAIQQEE